MHQNRVKPLSMLHKNPAQIFTLSCRKNAVHFTKIYHIPYENTGKEVQP